MNEFKKLLLGELTIPYYLAAGVFCLLAIIVSLWLGSQKRNIPSPSTPILFSWKFLFWDNTKRVIIGMILMFLFFRFAAAAIGKALSMELAVGIGFFLSMGLDQAIGYLKQKFSFFQMDREKFKDPAKSQP